MDVAQSACELCSQAGGEVVHQAGKFRVVLVDDAAYPGFCRVMWNEHVREMTDLPAADRALLMDAVWRVEAALRETMAPVKLNLASLGNMVPHLHWHLIPRFADDTHFPAPVWGQAQRTPDAAALAARMALLPALRAAIVRQIKASPHAGETFLAE
jgi:diadenosine tetraphosphate (Ap4A) HIT family hydrolase